MKTQMFDNNLLNSHKQNIELLVFLFFIVPSMVLSFFASSKGDANFVVTSIAVIMRDLSLVFLVLYFVWCSHEPFSLLGLRARDTSQEVTLGFLLFVPFFYGANLLGKFLVTIGLHAPRTASIPFVMNNGIGDLIVAVLLVIVVAFSEEIIFRGYLMLRFKGATASTFWAVIFSAVVFSLGHGYEGSAGVVTVGVMGLTFSLIYLWRGNLITAITIHFLQDFVSIVLIPIFVSTR
jgi:membrane protease YdiL (CAAX protease family)